MKYSLLALLAVGSPSLMEGQVALNLDAGSGTMRVGSGSSSGILRFAPSVHLRTGILELGADADYAGLTSSGWQTTGTANGGLRHRRGLLDASLGFTGGWSRTTWGRTAGSWMGEGRLGVASQSRGATLMARAGRTLSVDGPQPTNQVEAGAWQRVGRLNFGFWLRRTGLTARGETDSIPDPRDTLSAGTPNIRVMKDYYTDAEATVGWKRGAFSLDGGIGRRFGKPAAQFTSWHVRGSYQLNDRVALVASTGQFPVDVVTGFPSGSFTTLSMRFNLAGDGPTRRVGPHPAKATRLFQARAEGNQLYLVTVWVPDASTVEMMGGFSNWEPVLMVPTDDDRWQLRIRMTPGIQEANIRIDGRRWSVPPGLTGVDDGLGGTVGVFVAE